MRATRLEDLSGTKWKGQAQVWLHEDELAVLFDTTVHIGRAEIHYAWEDRRPHHGEIVWRRSGNTADLLEAAWMDNRFTGPGNVLVGSGTAGIAPAEAVERAPLLAVTARYAPNAKAPPIRWRVVLVQRPEHVAKDEIVLQVFNGAPWGEEHLAMQVVGRPA